MSHLEIVYSGDSNKYRNPRIQAVLCSELKEMGLETTGSFSHDGHFNISYKGKIPPAVEKHFRSIEERDNVTINIK